MASFQQGLSESMILLQPLMRVCNPTKLPFESRRYNNLDDIQCTYVAVTCYCYFLVADSIRKNEGNE